MTTLHRNEGADELASGSGFTYPPLLAFVKGAPDVILELCGHRLEGGRAVGLTGESRKEILDNNREMASDALRVLGVAYRPLQEVPDQPSPRPGEGPRFTSSWRDVPRRGRTWDLRR